MQVYQGYSKLL